MGCGEARLACSVGNTVYSYDLVSKSNTDNQSNTNNNNAGNNTNHLKSNLKNIKNQIVTITACDIAHVPLADQVCISLSLYECTSYSFIYMYIVCRYCRLLFIINGIEYSGFY